MKIWDEWRDEAGEGGAGRVDWRMESERGLPTAGRGDEIVAEGREGVGEGEGGMPLMVESVACSWTLVSTDKVVDGMDCIAVGVTPTRQCSIPQTRW